MLRTFGDNVPDSGHRSGTSAVRRSRARRAREVLIAKLRAEGAI